MTVAPSMLVIIPAWNEAASVGRVVREVQAAVPGASVLVVDDGSRDATSAESRAAGARVARLPCNLGVGAALRLGYRYARDFGFDVAVQVDADGQHDPRYLPALVAGLDSADLVIGARFAGVGDYRVSGPRRWAMRLLAVVVGRIAGHRLTDVTSGFRAVNRDLIELFATWYPVEYMGDTVETTVHAARSGYAVRQVPVAMRTRLAGTPSHPPAKATLFLLRALLVLLLALLRPGRPGGRGRTASGLVEASSSPPPPGG